MDRLTQRTRSLLARRNKLVCNSHVIFRGSDGSALPSSAIVLGQAPYPVTAAELFPGNTITHLSANRVNRTRQGWRTWRFFRFLAMANETAVERPTCPVRLVFSIVIQGVAPTAPPPSTRNSLTSSINARSFAGTCRRPEK